MDTDQKMSQEEMKLLLEPQEDMDSEESAAQSAQVGRGKKRAKTTNCDDIESLKEQVVQLISQAERLEVEAQREIAMRKREEARARLVMAAARTKVAKASADKLETIAEHAEEEFISDTDTLAAAFANMMRNQLEHMSELADKLCDS